MSPEPKLVFRPARNFYSSSKCFHEDRSRARSAAAKQSCFGKCCWEIVVCPACDKEVLLCGKCHSALLNYKDDREKSNSEYFCYRVQPKIFFIAVLIFLLFLGFFFKFWILIFEKSFDVDNLKIVYPSQKNETWYHILSALDKEIPSVKCLMLLHGDDKKTSNCLIKRLIYLFNQNDNLNVDDITFKNVAGAEDYGQVLQYYRPIIEKYRIFLTDLNKVPANYARIFHSLCDDVSSDIKPSLFIFTLKYYHDHKDLKPIEKATLVLKEIWKELSENEFFPLLSRVVRNVIEVVPEKQLECL